MKGKKNSIKGLVFDNPNSSTVKYMDSLAGLSEIPKEGVFSFKTNDEVIRYVEKNPGMIGVVGMNWLSQPNPESQKIVDNLLILSVKNKLIIFINWAWNYFSKNSSLRLILKDDEPATVETKK